MTLAATCAALAALAGVTVSSVGQTGGITAARVGLVVQGSGNNVDAPRALPLVRVPCGGPIVAVAIEGGVNTVNGQRLAPGCYAYVVGDRKK